MFVPAPGEMVMRIATLSLLLCSVFVVAQIASAPASKTDQPHQSGDIEILSDTHGVDFRPYVRSVLEKVRAEWYSLIPESAQWKKGRVVIEFAITKDGKPAKMRLVQSSGDVPLDRAAWGGIYLSKPFPPLPADFNKPEIVLRCRFFYNPDKQDAVDVGLLALPGPSNGVRAGFLEKKVKMTISPIGGPEVPVGGTKMVVVSITGTKETGVVWSVRGPGCSGSACGEMAQASGLYVAPSAVPNPPLVTLSAVSKEDPLTEASVVLRIVEGGSTK
jgi:TonB family protein